MKKFVIGTVAVTFIATPILFVAAAGTANAFPTANVIGGRERIKVMVHNDQPTVQNCVITVNGAATPVVLQPNGDQVVRIPAPAGSPLVQMNCPSGGLDFNAPVIVQPANPALDALDAILVGAGSSALATDPALR